MKRIYLIVLGIAFLLLCSCAQPPAEVPTPETTPPAETIPPAPTPPPDTTPPSAITSLIAINAYDGRVNLWWDKSTAEDFARYDVYVSKTEITDTSGMTSVQQITDIATNTYQATGLEDGTKYYIAVTAVDKSGNESAKVTSVGATPTPMPRGSKDPNLVVDIYQPDKVWAGTTLLPDNLDYQRRRILEVNMWGEIIWEYVVPIPKESELEIHNFVEAELLSNNNILYTVGAAGVYEIDRDGKFVWQYLTKKIDHDADRLPNGNTIFVFGNNDQKSDAQVTEVNPKGEIVWQWYAKDYFDKPPFNSVFGEGWTHVNAVSRLPNGNTLISPRNFDLVVEVDPKGAVVRTIGEGVLDDQHDPYILPNGNLLAANHNLRHNIGKPQRALEIDPVTGKIVWEYLIPDENNWPIRDANRLPNGNTLITGTKEVVEVTTEGEIVWRLRLQSVSFKDIGEAIRRGFYKADRISAPK